MRKITLLLLLSLLTHALAAQFLEITGNVVIENASAEGSRIVIFRNNEQIEEKAVDRRGRFTLRFALDADYRLMFEKNGYVGKTVSVRTEVPDEIIESNPNFPPIKLIITLMPHVTGVDLSIFDQPVAILAYSHELDDFVFDKDYAGRIQKLVAATESDIRRVLSQSGSEALAKEQMFADLVAKGDDQWDKKNGQAAVENWEKALAIKPDDAALPGKISEARSMMEKEAEEKRAAAQRVLAYERLIKSGDSLFVLEQYAPSREKFSEALSMDAKKPYPANKIKEIDQRLAALQQQQEEADSRRLLVEKYNDLMKAGDQFFGQKEYAGAEVKYKEAHALNYRREEPEKQLNAIAEIRRQEAERLKKEGALNDRYDKAIAGADQQFAQKRYQAAVEGYRQALAFKPEEAYPQEMIGKAEAALAEEKRLAEAEAERRRQEEAGKAAAMEKYRELVEKAGQAFAGYNYSLARNLYAEADKLNTGERLPAEKIAEIDEIIHSAKYKEQLAGFNKQVEWAEKAVESKNYAGAKVYYQKAIAILPIDKEKIEKKIAEIDEIILKEQLAAIEKEYKANIEKADKAYGEKSYAIAKFYYQKALEIKKGDAYARGRLADVEKNISDRTEKTMEL